MTNPKNGSGSEVASASSSALDWPLVTFFVMAYLISWGMVPILGSIARQSGVVDWITLSRMAESLDFSGTDLVVPSWVVYLITRLQDFAFSIAGIVLIASLHGRAGLRELGQRLLPGRVAWPWLLAALLPFGLYALAVALSGALGSFTFSAAVLGTILFSAKAGFLVYFFLRGAMGEELGLRGFALPRLQASMSPFRASVIIGVLWAAWHLPVLWGRDAASIVVFLLLAFVLSFIFTWLFNGSGGSLIPVILFHAAQNAEEIFEITFPDLVGSDWEIVSSVGLLLVGVAAAYALRRRSRA